MSAGTLMADSIVHTAEAQTLSLVAGAAFIASFGLLTRWMHKHIVRPLLVVPTIVTRQEAMTETLNALTSDVAAVKAEVHANHGSSLRDSTNRNEVLTRALAERVGVDPNALVPPMPSPEVEPD